MRSSVRRGLQALCIGLVIQVLLFAVGILTRTPQVPGHPSVLSPLSYFSKPGLILELLVVSSFRANWNLHPVWLQLMTITGNVLFYGAIAYLMLRWRAAQNSAATAPDNPGDSNPRSSSEDAPLMDCSRKVSTRSSRRVWLALAIGLAATLIAYALVHMNLLRPVPNEAGGVMYSDAYPQRILLTFPGVFLILIAINLTPIMWGQHPVLVHVVAATGNFLFYSLVAYLLLRATAALSARWKRQ